MNNRLILGCIADDFTGASDAASFLAQGGLRTLLACGVPEPGDMLPSDIEAVVVALKTRTVPVAEAVRDSLAALSWLRARGAQQFYFKYCSTFDSTPAGNIGPVADALLDALGARFSLVCPALPVNGRTVRDGILYVNGVPLHESPMRNHPLTPMWDARLQVLLAPQSRYPSFDLPLDQMAGEPAEARQRAEALAGGTDRFYLIPDQYEGAHAARIIELFGDLPLLTGGSGLLAALAAQLRADRAWHAVEAGESGMAGGAAATGESGMAGGAAATGESGPAPDDADGTDGPALLLAGSCSTATRAQIASFKEGGGQTFKVDPAAAAGGDPDLVERAWRFIVDHPEETVLIYSADPPEILAQTQARLGPDVADRIEAVFSDLAERAAAAGFKRVIVAGGETSGAVTSRLGLRTFRLGSSVAPGVPILTPSDRPDLRLVLKSGNFGQTDFFQRALYMTAAGSWKRKVEIVAPEGG